MEEKIYNIDPEFIELQMCWEKIKAQKHEYVFSKMQHKPKFCYKWLLTMKILMAICYIGMFIFLFTFFIQRPFSAFHTITFAGTELILLIYVLWYVAFIKRILTLNVYKDSPIQINKKKAKLLLMEKMEWIVSFIIVLPIFFLFLYPTACYIYDVVLETDEIILFLLKEISKLVIIGLVLYYFNKNSIKVLRKEIINN